LSKHKSEDYKLSAVKYYLNNNVSLDDVCEIFDCPKQSLYRWVKRYEELEEIKRCKDRKHIKEKVKKVVPDFEKSSKDLKVRQKKPINQLRLSP
jgi:transposase-like protein